MTGRSRRASDAAKAFGRAVDPPAAPPAEVEVTPDDAIVTPRPPLTRKWVPRSTERDREIGRLARLWRVPEASIWHHLALVGLAHPDELRESVRSEFGGGL